MQPEQIYTRARLVLPTEVLAHATLVVRGGHIAAIDASPSQVPGAIDCRGDYLLPGLVEVHTDNLERHVMPRPRVTFPMRSALQAHDAELASCGITTVFDAVGVGDPYDDGFRAQDQSALLQALDELDDAGLLRARHYIHARCELPAPNALALFEPFAHHARLRLISLMDHTPGQRQWTDTEQARIFYTGRKGWSDERFARELALAPERQARHAEPQRRWFADFARSHGIALATHDDTTPAHVDEALALGAGMSEFPTTLAAAQRARHLGLTTIAGAPNVVRGGSHSGNVSALQLAQAGVLDGLSSDYVPGSLLQAAWHLHHEGGFSLPEAVAVVTRGPALAAGMHDRGELVIGQLGDLVQVRELTGRPVLRAAWRGAIRIA
jgi:alpha-D-ribose 1-methylphosphonate 5-triphosphate diphosphatase